jgi:enamine deaminase RidA (YjgF/YER057c/UK114 family)
MVRRISSGSTFEKDMAYSRAVVDGDWVFVSGTTGFDYSTMKISDDVARQTEQCFKNIAMVAEAGACSRTSCVHYIVPGTTDFPACWPAMRAISATAGRRCSARACRSRMKIEIEVTARKGN